jgi:hypothetical protein
MGTLLGEPVAFIANLIQVALRADEVPAKLSFRERWSVMICEPY